MSLSWQNIDFKLPSNASSKSSNVFTDIDSSIVVISGPKTTCIVRYHHDTLAATSTDVIENDGAPHKLFSNSGFIYKLTDNGSLSKLLCTPSVTMEHGAVFGSSGSSSSDVFSWGKIPENIGNVANVAGIKNGFAAVVKSCGFHSLNIYEHPDNPSLEYSKKLGEVHDAEYSIFSFKCAQLSQTFLRHIFPHLYLVLTDIIVLASPTGTIFLFPVLADKSIHESYPIYYNTDKLMYVTVTPCKTAFVLIYKNGRVVLVAYNDNGISYKTFYLSANITTVSVLSNGLSFSIIWSDGVSVCYTIPKSFIDFSCDQMKTPIKFAVKIVSFGAKILLFNINCCIYVAELINDSVKLQYSEVNLKKAIVEVSKNIDDVKDKLKLVENYLEAIKNEKIDVSELKLDVINCKLYIENLSLFLFKKDYWRVFIRSSCELKNCTKTFALPRDLGHGDQVVLNLRHFVALDSSNLQVYLIGHTYSKQRLLRIPIGSISISSLVNS